MTDSEVVYRAESMFGTIDEIYRKEILLMQEGRFEEWLQLFDHQVRYWMPTRRVVENRDAMVQSEVSTAYFDDTFESLQLRVRRMASRNAFTEIPPSVTRYFVQLLDVQSDHGITTAISNQLVIQHRSDRMSSRYSGNRTDRFKQNPDGELSIVERRIVLDERVIAGGNISVLF